jgi:TonB family protein
MFRAVLVIAVLSTSHLLAGDFTGQWAGTIETDGSRLPIYLTLSEHEGMIGGSVASGSRMPIYLAPNEHDAKTGASVVTGSVPAAIEKGEVRNGEISFEIHDNAHRLTQFRLTLTNGVLSGDATVGGEVSKIAVVPVGGGSGGRVAFSAIPVPSPAIGSGSGVGSGAGAGIGGGVFRVGGGVSAPIVIHKVEPEYTEEARAAKYQGTVLLYIEIGPEGTATNIKVQRSLGLGLDEKAVECVKQWRFKPGQRDGKPVTVAATIEVNFRL